MNEYSLYYFVAGGFYFPCQLMFESLSHVDVVVCSPFILANVQLSKFLF